MQNDDLFKDYHRFSDFRENPYYKTTLFENENLLVGLNCLMPGQDMQRHAHDVQTRFYVTLQGSGEAWVGDQHTAVEPGTVIWVPAENLHKVLNTGTENMVLLVGIAPAHAD